ncbi:MAG: hypothetical protein IT583_04385 [Verrucomicrobia bacterium]|nr:hypothetical protein [Verrucomicrobiota bacterium]
MKNSAQLLFAAAVLLAAGCKTTESKPKPVSWKEQSAYMAGVSDPRRFNYSIYQTPVGVEYRGGCRLHPKQGAELAMGAKDPLRPVVPLQGKLGSQSPFLLDFCSLSSWMEFDLAQKVGAKPIGERNAELVKYPGEEIAGCLSVVPTLRLKQLYIENPLVYVRMANGAPGPMARGIEDPEIKGVLGWELVKKFEQIQLDYPHKRVLLATQAPAYSPDPALLVGRVPLVKRAGVCAVRGLIDGKAGMILIDPAGDFEVATDDAVVVSSIQLDEGLTFSAPAITKSPGGTRIGARLLQNYRITICPTEGAVYFEKPEEK